MRLAFFLLTVVLIAVSSWALWEESHPEWRRYQETLRGRMEERLLERIESARRDLDRPEVRGRLATIDARLAAIEADSGQTAERLRTIGTRLADIRASSDRLRARLREEESHFRSPEVSARYRAVRGLEAQARKACADVSGAWPPDQARLALLEARRDSLAKSADSFLETVDGARAELGRLGEEETRLRGEAARLGAPRDSLEAERDRIFMQLTASERALARLRARAPRIRELVSAGGQEVARCPTCHGEPDDGPDLHPALAPAEVFADLLCTECHRGDGRALDVERAHRGLVSAGVRGAGSFSLQGRIDRLRSPDPSVRRAALEALAMITGIEPPAVEAPLSEVGEEEAGRAAAWLAWWEFARRYFETAYVTTVDRESEQEPAGGLDLWLYSAEGRPLRYVGSKECLGCHQTTHRQHCERWMTTKFRSLERLRGERHPERCYRCHATGYDPGTGTYAEAGVTCEACHGPGERYSEMMFVGAELSGRGETGTGRALLDYSARIAREAVNLRTIEGDNGRTAVCVSCHHPRRHKDGGPGALESRVNRPAAAPDSSGRAADG